MKPLLTLAACGCRFDEDGNLASDCGPEGKLFEPRRTFLQRLLSNSWKGGKAMSDGTTYYQCEVCGIGVMNYREPCNVCAKIAQARAEAYEDAARIAESLYTRCNGIGIAAEIRKRNEAQQP